jgi:ADP-ribose pyrophosphatase
VRPDEARTVYDGALFDVTLERWGRHEREIVEHPGAVCVVAVDREGCVALVRQLREATGGELLELPAGTAEPGETPIETARRELAEETGLTGGRWREVCAFWTTPGFTRERMTLFFAEGVEPGEASPEEDESFELVRWPSAEIESRLGEIEDAKSLVGLLLYLRDMSRPAVA